MQFDLVRIIACTIWSGSATHIAGYRASSAFAGLGHVGHSVQWSVMAQMVPRRGFRWRTLVLAALITSIWTSWFQIRLLLAPWSGYQ